MKLINKFDYMKKLMKKRVLSIIIVSYIIISLINVSFSATQADKDRIQQQINQAQNEKDNIANQKKTEQKAFLL